MEGGDGNKWEQACEIDRCKKMRARENMREERERERTKTLADGVVNEKVERTQRTCKRRRSPFRPWN